MQICGEGKNGRRKRWRGGVRERAPREGSGDVLWKSYDQGVALGGGFTSPVSLEVCLGPEEHLLSPQAATLVPTSRKLLGVAFFFFPLQWDLLQGTVASGVHKIPDRVGSGGTCGIIMLADCPTSSVWPLAPGAASATGTDSSYALGLLLGLATAGTVSRIALLQALVPTPGPPDRWGSDAKMIWRGGFLR